MKKIKLTQSQIALIDDDDFEKINQYKWYTSKTKYGYYAAHSKQTPRENIYMHRLILNVKNKKLHVDHINGNTLDNRKKNLRICTQSQNSVNRLKNINNTSGVKGVMIYKGKFQVRIIQTINGKRKTVYYKRFDDINEAKKMYDKKMIELYGEFAKVKRKAHK